MTDASRSASIYTLGCRLNQAESAALCDRLEAAGYVLVPHGQPADLAIVHTCTVTHEADAKSRKAIRNIVRKHPQSRIVVMGCYAELRPEVIAEIEGVDLVIGNRRKLDFLDFMGDRKNAQPVIVKEPLDTGVFAPGSCGESRVERRTNLKIQDGCDHACTYCIVPRARGRSRSRAMDDLVAEAELLAERGAKELVLSGVHVGDYSFEGKNLLDVIERLKAIEGLTRIRIGSINVHTVPVDLFGLMNDPAHKLVPFLHIPLQSGSDSVLRRMNRRYTAPEFLACTERASVAVHDLCLGTDILVGMPGETEDEFDETCRFFERSPLNYAHVFIYSARPGTPAAAFPDHVDPRVMQQRSERVRLISDGKWRRFCERFLGHTMDVLFEQRQRGKWMGYTGNYIAVTACFESDLTNEIRPVVLERVTGETVQGRLADA